MGVSRRNPRIHHGTHEQLHDNVTHKRHVFHLRRAP